jgi:hypothetical protein
MDEARPTRRSRRPGTVSRPPAPRHRGALGRGPRRPDDGAMPAETRLSLPVRSAVTASLSLLKVAAIGVAIAVLLALVFRASFLPMLAYTMCITVGCWLAISQGLRLAARLFGEARPGWPALGWTVLVLLLGTALGVYVGNLGGSLLTGQPVADFSQWTARAVLSSLLVALVPGAAFTWYHYARSQLAAAEAQAQAALRAAAENQLRLLQSQLEPHMLFNTLANLRVLIGLDPARAQGMLDRLIAFLRATLNASRRDRHPLGDEFATLADYLALISIRMGPRLQSVLDLPDDLRALPLPPLLLQPLVENSIKHGLEPKVEGGRITVAARRHGDRLLLTVRDTGLGLGAPSAEGTRFGLQQVRERLRTLYGEAASLTLENAADDDGGALATLSLPVAGAVPDAASDADRPPSPPPLEPVP